MRTAALIATLGVFLNAAACSKEIVSGDKKFFVNDSVFEKNELLIQMILKTESMDEKERQYWFDMLPSMTGKQIDRLYEILETERNKLKELEDKYQKEISQLNEKHLIEWERFSLKETAKKSKKGESNNLYYLQKDDEKIPRIEMKKLSGLSEKDDVLTPSYFSKGFSSDNFSQVERFIFMDFSEKIIENISEYKKFYTEDGVNSYLDSAALLASKYDNKPLLYKIAGVSERHKDIVLKESGNFSEIAKRKYSNDIESNKEISNISYVISVARDLSYMRANDECRVYCGYLLEKLANKISGNHEKINKSYINRSEDNPFIFTAPMWIDVVYSFNSDLELSPLLKLRDSLVSSSENVRNSMKPKWDIDWYYRLQRSYFESTINSVHQDVKKIYYENIKKAVEGKDYKEVGDSEGPLLEAAVFNAVSYIKQNDIGRAREIISEVQKVGSSMGSPAFGYMEHDLRDYLGKMIANGSRVKGIKSVVYNQGGIEKYVEFGNKYAVVIGISEYEKLPNSPRDRLDVNVLTKLKYADNDAKSFMRFLKNVNVSGGGWNVTPLINSEATMSKVRRSIDEILSKVNENDLVYLFFSGHGRNAGYNGDDPILMTVDAGQEDLYTGIELSWLEKKIRNSKAKHIIVFLDACHSGAVNGQKGTDSISQEALMKLYNSAEKTKVIFSSGTGGQLSFEDDSSQHGFFTKFLLKALEERLAPELTRDGLVDLYEAQRYVEEEVRKATKDQQRPQIPNVTDFGRDIIFPLAIR